MRNFVTMVKPVGSFCNMSCSYCYYLHADNQQDMKEIRMSEIQKMGDEFLKAHMDEFVARFQSVGPDDYANISYTSGTTADPKGILLTHRNYTANVAQGHSVISIDENAVMLIILPLDHCFAHVAGMYTMMY